MNLTLHLIRKDLRALRWGLLLWVAACLTHLGLRLAQHARGDAAELTPFWRRLETTDRWDHVLVIALPVLLIPLLLHLDPLRGTLSFWKSVPISRRRLLTVKFATLIAFFIALPLACEVIYFLKAGLAVVLATALADWAWRFLPGITAVVLGCLFTRSLRVGVPGVALALCVAVYIFQWPYGRDRIANPLLAAAPAPPPGLIATPPGARIEIEPRTVGFERTVFQQSGSQREERLAVALRVHASGLPADVLIRGVSFRADAIHLPGRTVAATGSSKNPFALASGSVLPAQEVRDEFGRSEMASRVVGMHEWYAATEYLRFTAKDIAPGGALVEGTVHVALSRRRTITTLPLTDGAAWQPGLHRFVLSNVADPNALQVNFGGTLATILADPQGATGGLALTPRSSFALWLDHSSLPYRKHLQFISSSLWRNSRAALPSIRYSDQSFGEPHGSLTDITRSRRRTQIAPSFDPVAALRNGATPLQVARFSEEQAQVRNWRLTIVTYDDLGTIELPLKAVVPRPRIAPQEDEESDALKPSGPSLGTLLTEIVVPSNPTRDDAQRILTRIAEVASQRNEDSIRRHENVLLQKLAALGAHNLEALLQAAAKESGPLDPRADQYYFPANSRADWRAPAYPVSGLFYRIVRVIADLARPEDKALVLRYHAPRPDLLEVISNRGWEEDALPQMCSVAKGERPVPVSWLECFLHHPSTETRAALLAQVRARAVDYPFLPRLLDEAGLPPREVAGALWETAVVNTGNFEQLKGPFAFAARHGVEQIPRDLVRILRFDRAAISYHGVTPLPISQAGFAQSFSLRSDCPPTVADARSWLEQNVFVLRFDDASGRYELPGVSEPAPDLSRWGKFVDPLGAGRVRLDGDTLLASSAGFAADFTIDPAHRFAPRVMREIESDFTVEVSVEPTFDPAKAWSRNGSDIFQSAGLLLDAGPHRFLRFEQAIWKNSEGNELREETLRGGRNTVLQRGNKQWNPAKPVRLRISRRGDLFATAWQQDGGAWVQSATARDFGWPRKVRVGLLVVNTVTRPFSARFTDFKIATSAEIADLPAVPHPGGEPTPTGTKLGEWGTAENPVGAGIFKTDGGALSIEVAPQSADYNVQQRMTAPLALNEVEGDFTFEATLAPTPRLHWNSTEVLITAGADYYLRVGVAFYNGKPYFTWERAEQGGPVGMLNLAAERDLTKPIRIRLQRRGWMLTIAHQQEGGAWTEFYPQNLRAWPAKIQVGVAALNTSKEPFTARFSDLKFTRD